MAAPSALVSKQPDHSLEVPITQKIALTLPECSALSGFKVCALRAAIWAGELALSAWEVAAATSFGAKHSKNSCGRRSKSYELRRSKKEGFE
jgi:hypothetical protein